MAPNPQAKTRNEVYLDPSSQPAVIEDEGIVISGISGMFPKSRTVMELMENLYNKVDMVEEVNYENFKHPSLPKHSGKLKNIEKFDAQFFRVTPWQANSLDPMARLLMENAFSAIYDSGMNPISYSGTKLGVFIGSSYSDTVAFNLYSVLKKNDFIISGSSKTMQANRISYWIDGKAQSAAIDQGCTSSMACLELAYNCMKRGDCDAALVGGCNMCSHPVLSINLKNAEHLCLDGKTKCFDKNGDGYVRSEAVNLLFLQKAKDAKRIYAEIYHIKSKYFARTDDNLKTIRKSEDIQKFLKEFYTEIKVDPSEVEYIEAASIGIAEADAIELDAIGKHFATIKPVKVGCIKSNMGNTEAVNGLCALTKLCLAYHKGELPGNLHYHVPQNQIATVRNGDVQILTENTHFDRSFAAMNSFSFTGNNYHVLLKCHFKAQDKQRNITNIPRLVLLSGREERGIEKVLNLLVSHPIDPEQIALLHNIYKMNIPAHTGRSYVILDTNNRNETVSLAKSIKVYSGASKPLWFLYSGMGSQWCGMGTDLMRIPIFAASIGRCHEILNPLGVNIIEILTSGDKSMFDNILNCMVGITAVQIGLTDILNAIGISPDNIIGHSLGELGCAYADGCCTLKETILASYLRGIASLETPLIKGSMAAIGLGYKDVLPLCPPEIDVACHNSANSSTISGPADIMKSFIEDLVSRGIFAKAVQTSNIAYHSRYMSVAGPALYSGMSKLLKEPKLRSEKWISTSALRENWNQDCVKYASAQYFTNNLLNPVYLEEQASLIPKDAIILEIAPHGLLQAIVKKSHEDCINISLTKRGCEDPVTYLLESLGKLYQTGVNPSIGNLYPLVEFPVSTQTPLLSQLIEWEHSEDWPESKLNTNVLNYTSARDLVISIQDDDYGFIKGYERNGIKEFPESALLVLVWETFGMQQGKNYKDMSVTFSQITFYEQIKIEAEDVVNLRITIGNNTGRFEVFHGNKQVVTGFIKEISENFQMDYSHDETKTKTNKNEMNLCGDVLYKLLNMSGYTYSEDFQLIHSLNTKTNAAYIKWAGKWATFIDSLFQMAVFSKKCDGVQTLKIISDLSISQHFKFQNSVVYDNFNCFKAGMSESHAIIRCRGIELSGIIFEEKPILECIPDAILTRHFVPYDVKENTDIYTAISVNLQLVAENLKHNAIQITELINLSSGSISNAINDVCQTISNHTFDVKIYNVSNLIEINETLETNLLVINNISGNEEVLSIHETGTLFQSCDFILVLDQNKIKLENYIDYQIVTTIPIGKQIMTLLKKKETVEKENLVYIPIDNDVSFYWVTHVHHELQKNKHVVLVSQRQPYCGLFGFVEHLRRDKEYKNSLVIIEDLNKPLFNVNHKFYKDHLQKNLAFNVLKRGQWGSYFYLQNFKPVTLSCASLTSKTFHNFNRFTWKENPISSENIIQVYYAGPSRKDCQKVVNKPKTGDSFGMDFSGISKQGVRVMGLMSEGALAVTVKDPSMLWPVPNYWSLEDAATVPLPYVHAYYCLFIMGNIQKNQNIFVTGGAGALGQAVISICLNLDCNVFTTVSDEKKKRFLLKMFPKLKEENIAYSRHDSFFTKVNEMSKNQRCHIVVNSITGYLRKAAMKCVSIWGRFIDVSTIDMNENQNFGMGFLDQDGSYVAANVSRIFMPDNIHERQILQYLVADGIANGTVRPLSRVVFSPFEISRAFEFMSSSRHRGRVLIKMESFKPSITRSDVLPSISYCDGTQVVVFDDTDLGVELIDHLIKKGAKNIIVNVNPNYDMTYFNIKHRSWDKFDVDIVINSENLHTEISCEKILKPVSNSLPVMGIFLVQNYEQKQSGNDFEPSNFLKNFCEHATTCANLDVASLKLYCNQSCKFVVLSVCSKELSSEFACSVSEKICEARNNVGLPSLFLRIQEPIENFQSEVSKMSTVFNAMDISLKLKYTNAMTFNKPSHIDRPKSMPNIEKILSINDTPSAKTEDSTLEDINDCKINIEELKSELHLNTYSIEDLKALTIPSLEQLCYKQKRKATSSLSGYNAFYNRIEQNELLALDTFIHMKTLLPNTEEYGLMDRNDHHLIMIPDFEGRSNIFTSIAERLKIQAVTVQLGPDLICENIPEMAKILAKRLQSNYAISSKFYILGYSFGVNVALEVAKILEAEGMVGTVYCLDSSPDTIKAQINANIGNLDDEQLQNDVIEHMYKLLTGDQSLELKEALKHCNNWSEKLDICTKKLRERVHFTHEHQRSLFTSMLNRLSLARDYAPNLNLKSKLVLIRADSYLSSNDIAEDYNLSKHSIEPVAVFQIKSNHISAPYDCRVSNIVNKMLDPELLEQFKMKNLCEIRCTFT